MRVKFIVTENKIIFGQGFQGEQHRHIAKDNNIRNERVFAGIHLLAQCRLMKALSASFLDP